MSQTVCSRCLAALTEAEKRRRTLLCHMCEPAWTLQFESTMNEYAVSHHLHQDAAPAAFHETDALATPHPLPDDLQTGF